MIRTRFAPSPTGYLHIGGARTALFSWAFARHNGGQFILRIEDTDLERSTDASTQAILDGLKWLGIDYDEGPFYQMKRLARYQEIVDQLLNSGHAYYCYASKEELEALRTAQRERGEKPRYDGRWRDSKASPPVGVKPVIRFKTPLTGEVTFHDLVKGPITVANSELDDLVIMRADGVPTYNFGVVVDDLDMGITHVIRGDDHVNNTPRQINIMKALDAVIPQFAHVPMILGSDGERLSKRHGAVSVMQYKEEGYLPEALMNYLARLGWSHGDEEMFTQEQFISWFDLGHISRSPARFNPEKLTWLNQQYLKQSSDFELAQLLEPELNKRGIEISHGPQLSEVVGLLKARVNLIPEMADAALYFYQRSSISEELRLQHLNETNLNTIRHFKEMIQFIEWTPTDINECLKQTVKELGIKMPQIGIPLRVAVCGQTQTPSLDATLYLIGREEVLNRINVVLDL
ncbi:glutamate--tRNA ligase [Ferrovum sp. PN-J185]|uniref:glutamate--tRNA ligase n=1 Tax=Ferrovum sp. PN-J185 TaxID=1356306 RepID=UPI00079C5826|nr:glutamate--tRNA ligase [Ferrovum sp. PN-J185]KXW56424.1 glutamate--tRNA ligase [Ferrovum sp. PN-J185]MCC6069147.1 glutamate--tRNA ligase [Ferrovum sp. PN-J185]MDE1890872.1 glutamate--tRNA ligase [Betaproteobacteria bacterium]MDE2055816.1 glutamate--tRNA ligase [Betaproteobacteria bacterium]